jgi:hypothetical protein
MGITGGNPGFIGGGGSVTAEAVADRIGHDGHVYVFEDGRWSHNGKIIEDSDFSD